MAQFTVDGVAFDRIHKAVALNSAGEVLYVLTQLQEATIEITSESRDMVDKDGTLIKRIYTGKSGTFSATNAFLDANIIAQGSGTEKQVATDTNKIKTPFVRDVKRKDNVGSITIEGLDADSVHVVGESASGSMVVEYTKGTIASDTEFVATGNRIQLPTATDVAKFVIIGEREMSSGAAVVNMSDKFPGTVTLIIQAFTIDPCTPDIRRATYIRIPSFQTSPDHTITLSTEATLDYSGDMQTSYCDENGDKILYEMFFPGDDTVEE